MKRYRKVLVVDDNPHDLILIKELLQEEYWIKTVDSAMKAIQSLESESFDLVITDMCMPRMDGFALIDDIQNQMPDLPVIMLSASLDEDTYKQRINKTGVSACLYKPLEINTFMNTIKGVLAKSHK